MNRITGREDRAMAEHADGTPDLRILSMTPDGKTGTSIEAVLRQRLDGIAAAIRAKDVDRLMTFYAPDAVVFDIRPPLGVHGAVAYRQNFERWFASFEGALAFELHELRVAAGEGAAFSHYLGLVSGARSADHRAGYWVRGTTCFERRDGEWLVTHEHVSTQASQ